MSVHFKRCLIGLQKGVSKGLKGHLLQAKRALIESQLTPFYFLIFELSLQCSVSEEDRMTKRQKGLNGGRGHNVHNDRGRKYRVTA